MRKGSGSPGLRTAARRGHVPPSLYRPLVRWLAPGRVAQRESARLTRERSLVRTQPRPPDILTGQALFPRIGVTTAALEILPSCHERATEVADRRAVSRWVAKSSSMLGNRWP